MATLGTNLEKDICMNYLKAYTSTPKTGLKTCPKLFSFIESPPWRSREVHFKLPSRVQGVNRLSPATDLVKCLIGAEAGVVEADVVDALVVNSIEFQVFNRLFNRIFIRAFLLTECPVLGGKSCWISCWNSIELSPWSKEPYWTRVQVFPSGT